MRAYICQKKYVITFMVSLFIVISNSKQSKHPSTVKWMIQLVNVVRILHTPYTNDLWTHGFEEHGSTYSQILFNCKYHSTITHSWLNLQIGTVDMERQIQRAHCKATHDLLAAERVGTSSPSAVLGSTELLYACCALWRLLSHIWLCDPMDCSLPGFPVHGILQARILEWGASPSSRGSS